MTIKILGHRGINQPENKSLPYQNTLEAFNYAIEKGADGFELDVIASKDGKCFVIHDDDILKHGGGEGLITQLDSKEIKNKKLAGRYNIPALSEVLTTYSKKNALINIEIKQQGIAELVVKEIIGAKYPIENLLISSFNHHDLIIARGLNSNIKIGLLFGRESREDKNFEQNIMLLSERLAPTAFCMEKTLAYLSVLESQNEKYFWTIKKEDIQSYIIQGLMMYENVNFITDYPEELIATLRK
jgi:glycerophosphoryl diester phosphodiesterase